MDYQTSTKLIFILTILTACVQLLAAKGNCTLENYNPCNRNFSAVGQFENRRCLYGDAKEITFSDSRQLCESYNATPLEVRSKEFYESLVSFDRRKFIQWAKSISENGRDIELVWTNLFVNETGELVYRGDENTKLQHRPKGLTDATVDSCILLNIKTGNWSSVSCDKPAAATLCIKEVDFTLDELQVNKETKMELKSSPTKVEKLPSDLYYPNKYVIVCTSSVGARHILSFMLNDKPGHLNGTIHRKEVFEPDSLNNCRRSVISELKFEMEEDMVDSGLMVSCAGELPTTRNSECHEPLCVKHSFNVEIGNTRPKTKLFFHALIHFFIKRRAEFRCHACTGSKGFLEFGVKKGNIDYNDTGFTNHPVDRNITKKWVKGCGFNVTMEIKFRVEKSNEGSFFWCASYADKGVNKQYRELKVHSVIIGPEPPTLEVTYYKPPNGVMVGHSIQARCFACITTDYGDIIFSIVDVENNDQDHLSKHITDLSREVKEVPGCSMHITRNVSIHVSQEVVGKLIRCQSYYYYHYRLDDLEAFSEVLVDVEALSILNAVWWLLFLLLFSAGAFLVLIMVRHNLSDDTDDTEYSNTHFDDPFGNADQIDPGRLTISTDTTTSGSSWTMPKFSISKPSHKNMLGSSKSIDHTSEDSKSIKSAAHSHTSKGGSHR